MSANLQVNKFKNRLVNILPFESSRVCLQPLRGIEGSDYINASFIDGYRYRNAYIATQGPLNETVEDFWRMLWEHNSTIVVMLTKLREMGRVRKLSFSRKKNQVIIFIRKNVPNIGQVKDLQDTNILLLTPWQNIICLSTFLESLRSVESFKFRRRTQVSHTDFFRWQMLEMDKAELSDSSSSLTGLNKVFQNQGKDLLILLVRYANLYLRTFKHIFHLYSFIINIMNFNNFRFTKPKNSLVKRVLFQFIAG